MDTNGITPVMPVGGSDGGWGSNGFMGIFGLLILLGLFSIERFPVQRRRMRRCPVF